MENINYKSDLWLFGGIFTALGIFILLIFIVIYLIVLMILLLVYVPFSLLDITINKLLNRKSKHE